MADISPKLMEDARRLLSRIALEPDRKQRAVLIARFAQTRDKRCAEIALHHARKGATARQIYEAITAPET